MGFFSDMGVGMGLQSGALTNDNLKQFKQYELDFAIKPYTTQIETNTAKQKALTELLTKLTDFQTKVSTLGDSTAFDKRKVDASVTGDSAAASLVAGSGVSLGTLSVKVDKIAEKDVFQTGGFKSDSDKVLNAGEKATNFTFIQDGKEYKIQVGVNDTYADLAEKINSATDGKVVAKVVNTGEDGAPYRFTISSKDTGTNNAITFGSDSETTTFLKDKFGWNVKTTISDADMKGYEASTGTKSVNLSDQLGSDVNLTVVVNDEKYEIKASANETYQDLMDKVNGLTDSNGDPVKVELTNNNGKLSFTAKDGSTVKIFDGVKNANGEYEPDSATSTFLTDKLGIKLTKNSGFGLDDPNGEFHIKKAQNAEFTLDGVKMVRQSNDVTDIGAGLTLTLKKAGEINFTIKQDTEGIGTAMDEMVQSYNELMTNLQSVTDYNTDTNVAGDLQGVSVVSNIKSQIVDILFKSKLVKGTDLDKDGNATSTMVMASLTDFGLTLTQTGTLQFDQAEFNKMLEKDLDFAQEFFSGVNGFKDINFVGEGVDLNQDIDFSKNGSFNLTFNSETFDLSKDQNGDPWKLTGADAAERAKNLAEHINSFRIDGLTAKVEELNTTNGIKYVVKFNSDNGSDLEIDGDENLLKQIGLKKTSVKAELEEGTGIFADLKTLIKGMTDDKQTGAQTDGSLTLYNNQLTNDLKSLNEAKTNTEESIETKYATEKDKWIQYEMIIAKLKNQGNAVSQMLNSMTQTS